MANRMPQGKKTKIVDINVTPKQDMTKEQYNELSKKYQQAVEAQDMHYHNAVENLEADIKVVAKTYGSAEGVRAVLYNDVLKKLNVIDASYIVDHVKKIINDDIVAWFNEAQNDFESANKESDIWSSYIDGLIDYDFADNCINDLEMCYGDEEGAYHEFVEQLVIKDLYARFGQAGHDIDVQWQKDQELVDSIDEALKEAEKTLAGPNE